MRVMPVSYHNYEQKLTNSTNQRKSLKQDLSVCTNEVNFKGSKWAILESVVCAGLGFVFAGPVGAIVGAGLGAGVGSVMDDDAPSSDDSSKPYNP